jgi:hypothetical protein
MIDLYKFMAHYDDTNQNEQNRRIMLLLGVLDYNEENETDYKPAIAINGYFAWKRNYFSFER